MESINLIKKISQKDYHYNLSDDEKKLFKNIENEKIIEDFFERFPKAIKPLITNICKKK
jgi:hypothetical protein